MGNKNKYLCQNNTKQNFFDSQNVFNTSIMKHKEIDGLIDINRQ